MKTMLLGIMVCIGLHCAAQQCDCPPGVGDDAQTLRSFRFGGGAELGICGFNTIEEGDTSYTRFSLFLCGQDKPLERWDANITCKAERTRDALLIKEMYNLPVGQSFSRLWRPFYIHKYTYRNGAFEETEYIDKQLPRYTKDQVTQVIKQYNELQTPATEETMKVANMLFWAAVSGSKETEAMLKSIPGKFGPFDNVLSQEWEELMTVYMRWKEKNMVAGGNTTH